MNTPHKPPVRPSGPRNPIPASTETPSTESEAHRGVQRIRLDDLTSDQLDDLYDRMEAARALHKPLQRGPGVYCAHCSGWDGRRALGILTDYPCPTLHALDVPPQPDPGPTLCAHCGREVENRAEPTMGWPARDHWVHVPGAYTLCHPERASRSPRAEPRTAI